MASDNLHPEGPYRAPKGYGGIYAEGGTDPFFDFDICERIVALIGDLLEHPATRRHLEDLGLSYRSGPRGILLACTWCEASPCECGDLQPRGKEYMVRVYQDTELRPFFEARKLAVRGGV